MKQINNCFNNTEGQIQQSHAGNQNKSHKLNKSYENISGVGKGLKGDNFYNLGGGLQGMPGGDKIKAG